ncbi:MAG: ABC transporter ATP-binding protein [Chloroflexota bacterium]
MSVDAKKQETPVWRLMVRLARYRLDLFLLSALFASILFYVTPLLPGLVIRQIFNQLSGDLQAGLNLWTLLSLLVAIAVVRQTFMIGAVLAEMTADYVAATLMQRNVLANVLRRPGTNALPTSSGDALARLRDDVWEIAIFLTHTMDPVGQWFVMIVGLLILLQINGWLTLIVFGPIIITVLVVNQLSRRIQRYRQANQEAIGAVTGLLGELFGAVQAVKIAGTEAHVVAHFEEINEARRKAGLQDIFFTRLIQSFSQNAGKIGEALLLMALAWMLRRGEVDFTVGDFALFVSYIGWLSIVTTMFGNVLTRYRQTQISFGRVAGLMPDSPIDDMVAYHPIHMWGELPDVPFDAKSSADKLTQLTVSDLTYRYPNDTQGISDISFTLIPGTITVITGRVGSGKTTLLRVLLGLLPKDGGEIRWNGQLVDDAGAFLIPPRSAYTAQTPRLFSERLVDNILMGLPQAEVDLEQAIQSAVFEQDLATLSDGLETQVGPRGARLSGGQMQRTAAVRMFVRNPELLVFDDLSSALDVETERILWEKLFSRPEPPTCLVVSHRHSVLQRADNVILLKGGEMVDCGKLDELLDRCDEMQALWAETIR